MPLTEVENAYEPPWTNYQMFNRFNGEYTYITGYRKSDGKQLRKYEYLKKVLTDDEIPNSIEDINKITTYDNNPKLWMKLYMRGYRNADLDKKSGTRKNQKKGYGDSNFGKGRQRRDDAGWRKEASFTKSAIRKKEIREAKWEKESKEKEQAKREYEEEKIKEQEEMNKDIEKMEESRKKESKKKAKTKAKVSKLLDYHDKEEIDYDNEIRNPLRKLLDENELLIIEKLGKKAYDRLETTYSLGSYNHDAHSQRNNVESKAGSGSALKMLDKFVKENSSPEQTIIEKERMKKYKIRMDKARKEESDRQKQRDDDYEISIKGGVEGVKMSIKIHKEDEDGKWAYSNSKWKIRLKELEEKLEGEKQKLKDLKK
tara:strand:- start:6319 stop:7431 length:1113 start_codon:yes stop_codon:yes gene_type:complete